ncbi:Protein kinase domain-containing protein [Psidium guajava]|nr:Protein kinase domain-containing protein [Psidium guajava]
MTASTSHGILSQSRQHPQPICSQTPSTTHRPFWIRKSSALPTKLALLLEKAIKLGFFLFVKPSSSALDLSQRTHATVADLLSASKELSILIFKARSLGGIQLD